MELTELYRIGINIFNRGNIKYVCVNEESNEYDLCDDCITCYNNIEGKWIGLFPNRDIVNKHLEGIKGSEKFRILFSNVESVEFLIERFVSSSTSSNSNSNSSNLEKVSYKFPIYEHLINVGSDGNDTNIKNLMDECIDKYKKDQFGWDIRYNYYKGEKVYKVLFGDLKEMDPLGIFGNGSSCCCAVKRTDKEDDYQMVVNDNYFQCTRNWEEFG